MLPAMAAKPTVAIVGPGRLASTLAVELKRAGYRIREIISRGKSGSRRRVGDLATELNARAATFLSASWDADLIWFCVPDREIARSARRVAQLCDWEGKTAFHSSGALSSDELIALRRRGAAIASVHPLMTFVAESEPRLKGVPFGVEGDTRAMRLAFRIVRGLGGKTFPVRKKDKVAYHAWGTFTSPLLLTALVTAEHVARAAGVPAAEARKKMLPIVSQTFSNYASLGPARSFSGPIVRGDSEVVRRHLRVLRKVPEARDVYLALARAALRYLPARNRKKLERVLQK